MSDVQGSKSSDRQLAQFRTNVRAVWISVGVLAVGGILVVIANVSKWSENLSLGLGSGLVAVGALSLLSEIFLRRSLRRELLAEVHGRAQAERVGLRDALTSTRDFRATFSDQLTTVKKVDLMFINNESWIRDQFAGLESTLKRGGRVRVILPDHRSDDVVDQLLRRIDLPDEDYMRKSIALTESRLQPLVEKYPPNFDAAGKMTRGLAVVLSETIPTYSYYRLGDLSVVRIQEVQKDKVTDSPVLVLNRGGDFWKFANSDFHELFESVFKAPS